MLQATQLVGFGVNTEEPGEWQDVYTKSLTSGDAGSTNYSFRSRLTSMIGTGGSYSKVRVTIQAPAAGDTGIENASIGIYTGVNTNTTATPVPLLFSGSATATIPAGTTLTSDELVFAFSDSDDLVVIVDIDGVNGGASYLTSGADGGNQASGSNSYNSATGGLSNATRTYMVSKVEGFG